MSQVKLSWTAPANNVEVAGHLVERQDLGSTSFVQVGTTTGTSYNDTGLAAGRTYSYRVRAMSYRFEISRCAGPYLVNRKSAGNAKLYVYRFVFLKNKVMTILVGKSLVARAKLSK